MVEKCWLRDGCPCLTAACSTCQPTDDGCPVYRWFKKTIEEQRGTVHPIVKSDDFDDEACWYYVCDGCGKPVSPGYAYCPYCGKNIEWGDTK